MIGNSNGEANFPHKLLLANMQVVNLSEAFANNLSANIKLSKIQESTKVYSGGFLGSYLILYLKQPCH